MNGGMDSKSAIACPLVVMFNEQKDRARKRGDMGFGHPACKQGRRGYWATVACSPARQVHGIYTVG